ncbi:hypothetical protein JMJ76_0004396 [Colletotrichum scovillei]|nr:hypothetical protein JMJ76_0004396 [Colletotrichum scovillei]
MASSDERCLSTISGNNHGEGNQYFASGGGDQNHGNVQLIMNSTTNYHANTMGVGLPPLYGSMPGRFWEERPTDSNAVLLVAVQDIRGWLVHLAHDNHTRMRAHHEKTECQTLRGTGTWLFECNEYVSWVSWKAEHGSRFLCFRGILGSGKTMLASLVTERIRREIQANPEKNVACTYFYFRAEDQSSTSLESFWATMLAQLLVSGKDHPLAKELIDCFEGSLRGSSPLSESAIYALFNFQAQTYRRVYLIIDEIEHVGEGDMRYKMQEALVNLPRTVRVLFTTNSIFRGLDLGEILELFIKPRRQDVEAYVRHRIDKDKNPHLKEVEEVIVENVTAIACNSKLFLLAKLHMNYLDKQRNVAQLKEALKELPNNTMGVFKPLIQRILDLERQADQEFNNKMARHVLTWVVHGRPGLTALQIMDSFAVWQSGGNDFESHRPRMEEMISSCAGLVTTGSDNHTLQLVHDSVKDFLFEEGVIPTEPPWQMAAICILYLSIETKGPSNEKDSSLMQYAACHWGPHLAHVADEDIENVEVAAMEFMGNQTSIQRSFLALGGIDIGTFHGCSGLHAAVHFNLPYWAERLLIEKKVNVDTTTFDDQTALHWAVRYGHLDLVKLLLKYFADPDKLDQLKESPLHKTLVKPIVNDVAIVEALVNSRARTDLKSLRGYSPMSAAIRYGPTSIAKIFIENQEDLEAEIYEGWTSLRHVFFCGGEIMEEHHYSWQFSTAKQTSSSSLSSMGLTQIKPTRTDQLH